MFLFKKKIFLSAFGVLFLVAISIGAWFYWQQSGSTSPDLRESSDEDETVPFFGTGEEEAYKHPLLDSLPQEWTVPQNAPLPLLSTVSKGGLTFSLPWNGEAGDYSARWINWLDDDKHSLSVTWPVPVLQDLKYSLERIKEEGKDYRLLVGSEDSPEAFDVFELYSRAMKITSASPKSAENQALLSLKNYVLFELTGGWGIDDNPGQIFTIVGESFRAIGVTDAARSILVMQIFDDHGKAVTFELYIHYKNKAGKFTREEIDSILSSMSVTQLARQ